MFPTFFIPGSAAPSDDYFGDVVLLIRGEGADGSTSFVDYSSYGHTATPNGGVQMDTAKMRNGRPSIYFDATSDFISFANHAGFQFGAEDFTIEAWVWKDSWAADCGLIDKMYTFQDYPAGAWEIYHSSILGLSFAAWSSSAVGLNVRSGIGAGVLPTGEWLHVAVNRTGGLLKMYTGGVLRGSTSIGEGAEFNAGTDPVRVGGFTLYSGTETFDGWVSELRITKGYGRYPAAFTPPSEDFPLQ